MFLIHFALLLAIIYIGIQKDGISLGLFGGMGTALFVFAFGLAPGNPLINVMLIILTVVFISSTLQTACGLNILVQFAEKFYANALKILRS